MIFHGKFYDTETGIVFSFISSLLPYLQTAFAENNTVSLSLLSPFQILRCRVKVSNCDLHYFFISIAVFIVTFVITHHFHLSYSDCCWIFVVSGPSSNQHFNIQATILGWNLKKMN